MDIPCENLLIGDSSLGNAIDSEEFSKQSSKSTINAALTGLYGYAGSYNILKVAHKHHPEMKNVILMQTLSMQTRKVSMDGYVRTVNSISDFVELTMKDKINFFKEYASYVKSIPITIPSKRTNLISNDYIKQSGMYQPSQVLKPLDIKKINQKKNKYLIKIINYCSEHHLNLIYVHGPIFEKKLKVSSLYIKTINKTISNLGINLVEKPIGININEIGDEEDHVNPNYKKKYTLLFYTMVCEYLIE